MPVHCHLVRLFVTSLRRFPLSALQPVLDLTGRCVWVWRCCIMRGIKIAKLSGIVINYSHATRISICFIVGLQCRIVTRLPTLRVVPMEFRIKKNETQEQIQPTVTTATTGCWWWWWYFSDAWHASRGQLQHEPHPGTANQQICHNMREGKCFIFGIHNLTVEKFRTFDLYVSLAA